MTLAREHLSDDGVFVQWMNVAFLDEPLLRSLTATLIDVFGSARIYRPDPSTLVFLASRQPLGMEQRVALNGTPISITPTHYARFGINCVEDLVVALAVDEDGARRLATGAEPISDDTNRMATSSVFELGRGLTADAAGRLLAEFDPLQTDSAWLFNGLAGSLDFGYIARRQLFFRAIDPSSIDRVRRLATTLGDSAAGRYVQVLLLASGGDLQAARQLARESLQTYPGDAQLAYAFLQPSLGAVARGESDPALAAVVAGLPPSAQATIRGSQFLLQNRFGDLAQLDTNLAESRWTDVWHFDALLLRAEWRSRVANPELVRRMADQAIELTDRASLVQPSLPLFAVRARAALGADRPDVLVESVASVAQWTAATSTGTNAEARARSRATLAELRRLLDGRETDPRVDRTRLEEVRTRIGDAIGRLK
jgi:hypothetical protein